MFEHILVVSWLLVSLVSCVPLGRSFAIRSIGVALILGVVVTFLTWFTLALFGGFLVEVLHLSIFGHGDNDLIYFVYFFPFPVLSTLALWYGGQTWSRGRDTDSGASPEQSAKSKIGDQSSVDNSLLGTCPNCGTGISLAAEECFHCKALFGPNSTWKVLR
jgi:hypothetical protein